MISLSLILNGALLLSLFVAGVVILRRGMRGVAIDDHPLCRRCGFDLVGLPDDASICSQCGADANADDGVIVGHRRRNYPLIVGGIVPILIAAAVLAGFIISVSTNVPWIRYQPFWYLRRQAVSSTPKPDPASAEILRRIQSRELSDAQLTSLIDQTLSIQANPDQTWNSQWGDWIESARATGKVSDEQWVKYLRAAPMIQLAARSQIRRGDKLPMRLEILPSRVGSSIGLWMQVSYQLPEDSLIVPRGSHGWMGAGLSDSSGGGSTPKFALDPDRLAATVDGPQVLKIHLTLNVFENFQARAKGAAATRELDLQIPWTLMPADATPIRIIEDPSLRPAMEKAITVRRLSMHGSPAANNGNLEFTFHPAPVSMAYRIFVRSGEREWQVGSIAQPAGRSLNMTTSGDIDGLEADSIDVVLRPDVEVALDSVELTEFWNGEIVVKGVPVIYPDARLRAQSSSPAPPGTSPASPGAPARPGR
jgi:hypothetical protein